MKLLSLLIVVVCLVLPIRALAGGNFQPELVLTIHNNTVDEPPSEACVMPSGGDPLDWIDCYDTKLAPGNYGFLSVHAGHLDNGFTGLPFGIQASGYPVTFLGFVPCPGFTVVLSQAGMPSAIMVTSTMGCRAAREAVGYLKYVCSDTRATFFQIVANADLGHYKVINCDYTFDEGTGIGGMAQWGGTRQLGCPYVWVGAPALTWGGIKSLFR
jgi:hypothetical protein